MSGSPFAMVSSSSASDTSKNVSYRDYSMVAPPENHESLLESTKSSTLQTFPSKLHYLLTFADIAGDQLNKVISWQPHGRCFQVHDSKVFVGQVLPNWFMQSKLASFQRQLNLYGFRRFTAGPDKGGYYHELFLRGRPDLAEHIRRTKVKGAGHRKAGAPETEPNFYREFPLPNTPAINATGNQAFKVLVAPQVAVPSLAQQLPIQLGAAAFASSPTHIAAPTKESAKEASSEATNHDRQAGQTGSALSICDQGITTTTTLSDGVDTDATAAFTSIQLPEPTNKPYIAPVIEPLVPPETKAQLKRFDPSPFLQQGLFGPNSLLALSPPLGKAGPPMRPEYHNECIIMDALRAVAPFYPDPPV